MSISIPGISGYDFTGIIDSMVQAYKLPENQLTTQKTSLETQKSAWQDVNTRLAALDATLTALKSAATWTSTTATSSNTSVLTSTGGSGALAGIYTVSVANTAYNEVVVSKKTDDTAMASAMGSTPYVYDSTTNTSSWDFSINGKNVAITSSSATPTLAEICSSINSAKTGVSASLIQVDGTNYRIAISSNLTGQDNAIILQDPNGTLGALGINISGVSATVLTQAEMDAGNVGGISQQAQDANFTVNGVSVTSATNTVKTVIQGVTLNLNTAGTSTVTVAADTSAAQKAVQAFVDQYNSVQSFISDKLSYDSTTKKAGALFGDPILQGIQTRLRTMLGGVINSSTSSYKSLSEVGISTSSANFGKDASLIFNTDKFTAALAADPQSVANLFSAPYNGVIPSSSGNVEGLGNMLHAYLYPAIMAGGSLSQTQTNLANQIKYITHQISDFDDRATAYEEMLKTKFSKLETLLSGMNSQSSWLTAQINSMTTSSSSSK